MVVAYMGKDLSSFSQGSWEKVRQKLRKKLGETAYKNWLKQISYKSLENETLTLSAPTKFLRDWVVTHYAESIKEICEEELKSLNLLKIVVKPIGGRIVPGTARLVSTNLKNEKKFDVS